MEKGQVHHLVGLGGWEHEAFDACFYPRSQKVSLRGLGVRFRIAQLDYFDGEE